MSDVARYICKLFLLQGQKSISIIIPTYSITSFLSLLHFANLETIVNAPDDHGDNLKVKWNIPSCKHWTILLLRFENQ
jgi:hypothetical protein